MANINYKPINETTENERLISINFKNIIKELGLGGGNNNAVGSDRSSSIVQVYSGGAQPQKQPLDAELTALAGLVSRADSVPYFTGGETAGLATLTSFARSVLDDSSSSEARDTLGASSGVWPVSTIPSLSASYQVVDAELTALASVTSAMDKVPYFTGSGTANVATLTSFGREIIGGANASSVIGSLGLDEIYLPLVGKTLEVPLVLTSGLTTNSDQILQIKSKEGLVTLSADGNGNLRSNSVHFVHNSTASTLLKGSAVHIDSSTTHEGVMVPSVILSDADVDILERSDHEVEGLVIDDIPANGVGYIINKGSLTSLDLHLFNVSEAVYLHPSEAGAFAKLADVPITSRVIKLGKVISNSATEGVLFVQIINEGAGLNNPQRQVNVISGNNSSTGLYHWASPCLSVYDATHFNVEPVDGWVVDGATDPENPIYYFVSYAGATNILDLFYSTAFSTYIYLDKASVLYQQATELTADQRRDNIYLGRSIHIAKTSITYLIPNPDLDIAPLSQVRDYWSSFVFVNKGIKAYPNGANLNFNTVAGTLFASGINWVNSKTNPNLKTIVAKVIAPFQYISQLSIIGAEVTAIDPANYDLAGTTTAVGAPNAKATNQRIFQSANGNLFIQRGQVVYSNLAEARANLVTESFVVAPALLTTCQLIGFLSITKNTTDLSNTSFAVFTVASMFGEVGIGTAGASTATLQQAYNNSVEPEITTNATLGAVSIKQGSGADTDTVLEVQNAAGTNTATITGNGLLTLGDNLFITKAITPSVVIGDLTSTKGQLLIRAAAGTEKRIEFRSADSARWSISSNTTVESGANAGSNFEINAYTDAGVLIDKPIGITRLAGGNITLSRNVAINGVIYNNYPNGGIFGYTNDGADNYTTTLSSTTGQSSTRGGYVTVKGNEVATNGGDVQIEAGNSASGTGDLKVLTGGTLRLQINKAGDTYLKSPKVIFPINGAICVDTSDASDDNRLSMCGGGAADRARGARITLNGNEKISDGGSVYIEGGDTSAVNGDIVMTTNNGVERMRITKAGLTKIASLTESQLMATGASKELVSLPVATYPSLAELAFVKGLTSAVQTQLTDKVSKSVASEATVSIKARQLAQTVQTSSTTTGNITWTLSSGSIMDLSVALTGTTTLVITAPVVGEESILTLIQGSTARTVTLSMANVVFRQVGGTGTGTGTYGITGITTVNAFYEIKLTWVTALLCYVSVS
jgi:hypothetical protein